MSSQQEGLLAAPPVAVSASYLAGVSMSDVVIWLTAIYTGLLVVHKVWRMYKEYQAEKAPKYGRRATDAHEADE
jgi:hypothetical protein